MDNERCRICDREMPILSFSARYVCCNGHDCACGGGTLPTNVCSTKCLEDEESEADEELGCVDLEERLDAALDRCFPVGKNEGRS